ncbi:uncharacterized protein KY384_009077 [Bacidia gigantensis]|uniref:uncharacterized protein n=1 Tax=Bacidia gigantensis TaxID=2732470 RepID=UPI001D042BEC|nr:uncharacterized protein KY384_009077 [Bacidia gigantensis]KAG8525433.1 hypothetical protein KY384_009077 [Bacidia gigantensis]
MPRGRPPAAREARSRPNDDQGGVSLTKDILRYFTHCSPPDAHNARTSIDKSINNTALASHNQLRTSKRKKVDHVFEIDTIEINTLTAATPTPQIMKNVIIPASRSSLGSSLSSVRGLSSESDLTPATSVAVTPVESVSRSIPKGKRKRTAEDDLVEADERLAFALQQDEWSVDAANKSVSTRHPFQVTDSDDELSEISCGSPADIQKRDDDLPLPKTRNDSAARATFSSITEGGSARKATRSKLSQLVQDSEGEGEGDSDLSEASIFTLLETEAGDSDESDVSEADWDATNQITQTSSNVAAVGASTPRAISTTVVHRRRGRRGQTNNRQRRTRWDGMNDRAARERKKLEKAHPEILTMWDELRAVPRIAPTPAEQPTTITRKLKSFQLEGLDWMVKQENSQWKGGLLGDEMGMGKTIQAVSLIMSDYPARDPTLVVVPPVALMQWQNEIGQYTDGKLNVLVYHNTNPKVKNMKVKALREYDVIMISYSGLESIYRKESKGWKREDGLVKENSKIHALHYHRLILDEAHNIKTRTTSVAKACFAVKADFKWCLSGTPVQNRIGEFFSLLRFLQIKPFASYFCKSCPCAQLHWNQDTEKRCSTCQHTGFQHVSIFNQELLNPITQQGDPQLRREGLQKLRLITDRIMLRRMKRDHTASMELPPKKVVIHNEFFGEIERDFSSSIMSNTSRQFDTYVSRGVMLNNYANIFGLIMQMRQVANHPDLILRKHAEGGQNVLVCCICDEIAEEPIRSRCHHEFCRKCARDYVKTFDNEMPDCPRCHISLSIDFDQPDIEQDADNVKKNSIVNRIKMEDWTSSTKIEMLVYDLYKLRSKKQTHKSIVFSQFTSMLQLVEWRLRRAGFNTVMLDGSMSPAQRQKSIDYFMTNVHVEVFLVSLKAGGVALNLTEASRVFIIDPWWNPAAEWQSADRCHRIGQKRPCVITRLCIEDSVESRMVMLQEKKANMINGTINNDDVAMEKLTPEDMQFLFRGG